MNPPEKVSAHETISFPSDTAVSFAVLVIAAVFVSVNFGQNIERSLAVIFSDSGSLFAYEFPKITDDVYASPELTKKYVLNYLRTLLAPVLSATALIVFALVIYYRTPARILGKIKTVAKESQALISFRSSAEKIAGSLFSILPHIVIEDSITTANAQAFGTRKKYYTMFDSGIALLNRKDPQLSNSIVYHEYSHIINKDIGKTYLAVSIWRASLILFAVPLFICIAGVFASGLIGKIRTGGIDFSEARSILTVNIPVVIQSLVQTFLLFATVIFLRNNLLSSREFYADLKASELGCKQGLLKILSSTRDAPKNLFARLLKFHPSAKKRIEVIEEPGRIFAYNYSMCFFAGVLISLIINGAVMPVLNIALLMSFVTMPGSESSSFSLLLSLFTAIAIPLIIIALTFPALSIPVAGTVGLKSIKYSYAISKGVKLPGTFMSNIFIVPALFIVGMELGFAMVPFTGLYPKDLQQLALVLLVDVFVFASLVLIVLISYFAGRSLAGKRFEPKSLKSSIRLVLLLEALIISVTMLVMIPVRLGIVLGFLNPLS